MGERSAWSCQAAGDGACSLVLMMWWDSQDICLSGVLLEVILLGTTYWNELRKGLSVCSVHVSQNAGMKPEFPFSRRQLRCCCINGGVSSSDSHLFAGIIKQECGCLSSVVASREQSLPLKKEVCA